MSKDTGGIEGVVTWELRDENGEVKKTGFTRNIITNVGDRMYAERGAGVAGAIPSPTGIRLGNVAVGSRAEPTKSGAASTLQSYLGVAGASKAFDGTGGLTSASAGATGWTITYKCTFAANEATTSGAITEAVIVNDAIGTTPTNGATGTVGSTIARVKLDGIGSKGASDSLTLTWSNTLTGA